MNACQNCFRQTIGIIGSLGLIGLIVASSFLVGRMVDRWWPVGDEAQAVSQSLRCYSPDELTTLLEGTGLTLESVESRGAVDFEENRFVENVPFEQAMQYLARLAPG